MIHSFVLSYLDYSIEMPPSNFPLILPRLVSLASFVTAQLHSPAEEYPPAPHCLVKEIIESLKLSISKNIGVMLLPLVLNLDCLVFSPDFMLKESRDKKGIFVLFFVRVKNI